ncbi:MAG TPA: ABC transporter substrate-binding protein [Acidimicrobiia bacterium]|jgi:ABC-type branched-subunit amino acid transport system substrate-binding protein
MRANKPRAVILVMILSLVLGACGGTGGETTTTAGEAPTTTAGATTTTAGATTTTAGDVQFDIGVTEDTITVGLLADLSGPFAPLVQDIVAAQEVYWDIVNEGGGIAGRQVEMMVEDTAYNPDQHRTLYEGMRDSVALLSQSTGSPQTAGVIDLMLEDDIVAIPLTWYSGWGDPAFDQSTVLEQQTNYCFESMNVIEYMSTQFEAANGAAPTWAVVTFPGEYGQDGAFGAKYAIEQLGLELVFDAEGLVTPTPDDPETEVITGIVSNAPDIVFATVNPTNLAVIMGGAAQGGYQGQWTGSVPSYDFRLLDSPVAPIIDAAYTQPGYNVAWGTDVPGMAALRDAMLAARPDLRPSDAFVIGWIEAKIAEEVLRRAAESGDMTRAGIKAAALTIEGFGFEGLAPDQSYSPPDDPNSYVTRSIAIFDPNLEAYTAAGGAAQTIGSAPEGGTTGSDLVEDFFVGEVAAGYDFQGRCFVP